MDAFYFITLVILIISLLMLIYVVLYNKFKDVELKLKEDERELDETLRQKYDIMMSIIQIIKDDELQKMENLKSNDLSSFDFIRFLTEYEGKIINEISSNKKLQKSDEIKQKLEDIEEINVKIDAEKRYYNDNVSLYNSLYMKFPSNIVAKFSKIKQRTYFDGKDLNDKTEKDFKL